MASSASLPHRMYFLPFVFLVLSTVFPPPVSSSHFRYGHIGWTQVDDNPYDSNPYPRAIRIKFDSSWRRSAGWVGGNNKNVGEVVATFCVRTPGSTSGSQVCAPKILTQVNPTLDYIVGTSDMPIIKYPHDGPFTISYSMSCRVGGLKNSPPCQSYTFATVRFVAGRLNASPVSNVPSINFVAGATGPSSGFQMPAMDPDGDPILYQRDVLGNNNANGLGSFTIHSVTGAVVFDPVTTTTGLYAIAVMLYDFNYLICTPPVTLCCKASDFPAYPAQGYVLPACSGTQAPLSDVIVDFVIQVVAARKHCGPSCGASSGAACSDASGCGTCGPGGTCLPNVPPFFVIPPTPPAEEMAGEYGQTTTFSARAADSNLAQTVRITSSWTISGMKMQPTEPFGIGSAQGSVVWPIPTNAHRVNLACMLAEDGMSYHARFHCITITIGLLIVEDVVNNNHVASTAANPNPLTNRESRSAARDFVRVKGRNFDDNLPVTGADYKCRFYLPTPPGGSVIVDATMPPNLPPSPWSPSLIGVEDIFCESPDFSATGPYNVVNPSRPSATISVELTRDGGTRWSTNNKMMTWTEVPWFHKFNPKEGSECGGTVVRIEGYFNGIKAGILGVKLGTAGAATCASRTMIGVTAILCTYPPGLNTAGPIEVTTDYGTVWSTGATYVVNPKPQVTAVQPPSGVIQKVTIFGYNFLDVERVEFGGVKLALDDAAVAPTSIVTRPLWSEIGATGALPFYVNTSKGCDSSVGPVGFSFVAPNVTAADIMQPEGGPITIHGFNFNKWFVQKSVVESLKTTFSPPTVVRPQWHQISINGRDCDQPSYIDDTTLACHAAADQGGHKPAFLLLGMYRSNFTVSFLPTLSLNVPTVSKRIRTGAHTITGVVTPQTPDTIVSIDVVEGDNMAIFAASTGPGSPQFSNAGDLSFTVSTTKTGSCVLTVKLRTTAAGDIFESGTVQVKVVVTPYPPPDIDIKRIFPKSWSNCGGTVMTLVGSHLAESATRLVKVEVGGQRCASFAYLNESAVTCTRPPGDNGIFTVESVEGSDTEQTTSELDLSPTVKSITPVMDGAQIPSRRLVLQGNNLGIDPADLNSVTFGTIPCTNPSWTNSDRIECTVGPVPGLPDFQAKAQLVNADGFPVPKNSLLALLPDYETTLKEPDRWIARAESPTVATTTFCTKTSQVQYKWVVPEVTHVAISTRGTAAASTTAATSRSGYKGITTEGVTVSRSQGVAVSSTRQGSAAPVAPSSGDIMGGYDVDVYGRRLSVGPDDSVLSVSFAHNTPCGNVRVMDEGHILCTIAPGTPGNETVNVTTTLGGVSFSTAYFALLPPKPTITAVWPETFVTTGGDYITVFGSLFLFNDETPFEINVGNLPCVESIRVLKPKDETAPSIGGEKRGKTEAKSTRFTAGQSGGAGFNDPDGIYEHDMAVCVMRPKDEIATPLFKPITDGQEGYPYLADPIYYDKGVDFAGLEDHTTENGGDLRLVVSLSKIPTENVTVQVSVPDITEAKVRNNVTFEPVDYFRPRTITITGIMDYWRDDRTPFIVITDPVVSRDTNFMGNNPLDLVFYAGDSAPVVTAVSPNRNEWEHPELAVQFNNDGVEDPESDSPAATGNTVAGIMLPAETPDPSLPVTANTKTLPALAELKPGFSREVVDGISYMAGRDITLHGWNFECVASVSVGGIVVNASQVTPLALDTFPRPERNTTTTAGNGTSGTSTRAGRKVSGQKREGFLGRLAAWFRSIDEAYASNAPAGHTQNGNEAGDTQDRRLTVSQEAARVIPPRVFDPKVLNKSATWCANPVNRGSGNTTTGRPAADFFSKTRGAIWGPIYGATAASSRGVSGSGSRSGSRSGSEKSGSVSGSGDAKRSSRPKAVTHRAAKLIRIKDRGGFGKVSAGAGVAAKFEEEPGVRAVPIEERHISGGSDDDYTSTVGDAAVSISRQRRGRPRFHALERHLHALQSSRLTEEARGEYQIVELWLRAPPQKVEDYYDVSVTNEISGTTGTSRKAIYYTDNCPEPGMWGRGADCSPCRRGGVCPGGYRLRPEEGYWNRGEDNDWVYECLPPEACRGWVATEDGGVPSLCNHPYKGDYCAECEDGYYKDGMYCMPCPSEESLLIMLVCSVLLWLVFAMCGWWLENRENLAHVIALIMALQSIGGVGGTVRHTFKSRRLRQIYDVVEYFTGNIRFLKPGCFSDQPYLPNYAIGLGFNILVGVPLILGVPIVARFATWWHWSDGTLAVKERQSHYRNRFVRCVIIYLTVIYLSISTQAFESFSCTQDPEGVWRLKTRPKFVCYGNDHLIVLGLSGSLLLLVTFGFPFAFVIWMVKNRDVLYTDYTFMQRYDFLYDPFLRPFKFLWILELFILGLGFAVSETLFVDKPLSQFIGLTAVFSILIICLIVMQPMRRGWENWVLLLLHCSNLAAVTINYLSTTDQLDEDLGAALVFILLLSLFAASLTFVIVVVYYVIVSWPEKPEWERMIPDEYREKVLGNSDDDEEVRDLVARANENVVAEFESTESEEEVGVFGSFFGGNDPSFGLWDGVWDSTKQLGKRVTVAVGLADESVDSEEAGAKK